MRCIASAAARRALPVTGQAAELGRNSAIHCAGTVKPRLIGRRRGLRSGRLASAPAKRLAAPNRGPHLRTNKRMGRDSNPRCSCPHSSFQDCRLSPLGHPSECPSLTEKGRPTSRPNLTPTSPSSRMPPEGGLRRFVGSSTTSAHGTIAIAQHWRTPGGDRSGLQSRVSRAVRFLFVRSRFCSTLPSDDALALC